jgi:regulator of replication initiation timing
MAVPAEIQQAAENSRKMIEELAKAKKGNPAPEGAAPENQDDAALEKDAAVAQDVQPSKADAGSELQKEPRESGPADQGSQGDSAGEPMGEPQGKVKDAAYWEQRFKTLEGKYHAELPRSYQENKELKRTLQNYEAEIGRLSAENRRLKEGAGQAQASPVGKTDDAEINPDQFEDYGDEIKSLVKQFLSTRNEIKSLREENNRLKEQVGGVYAKQSEQTYSEFLGKLREKIPSFDQIDNDPEFLDWIKRSRIDLKAVGSDRDVESAIEIYNSWPGRTKLQQREGIDPPTPPPPDPQANRRQVAPPKSRPAPPRENRRTWKRSDIEQFYQDVRRGVYSEEEADKIKRDIFNASREGRVTD